MAREGEDFNDTLPHRLPAKRLHNNDGITVKNLHDRKLDVTLQDQMPVPANEEIKVELNSRSTPPTKKDVDDKRGVHAWSLTLNPEEEKQVTFGYRISWPAEKRVVFSNR